MQILSARAQSLWAKAKARMHQEEKKSDRTDTEPKEDVKKRSVMTIEIRARTVIKVTTVLLLALAAALTLFLIRDKLLLLVFAAFLALVMDAHVRRLESFGIPRGIAVIILYVLFLSVAAFLVASLIPIVAMQVQDLARFINRSSDAFLANPEIHLTFLSDTMNERITEIVQQILGSLGIQDRASALYRFGQNLSAIAGLAVQLTGSVFAFFVNSILVLFLAFFIQSDRERIADFMRVLLPRDYRGYFDLKAEAIHQKVSQWFQGQLILCVSIGVLVYIALSILGMPYALTLALLAAFTEFIPYAGPIIGAIPAVLIALSQFGFVWAAVTAAVYYIVQLCENNLLVPLIMKHAVGLSPISILFGMLVGVSFPDTVHPVVGIILAVPTTAIITIFVQDFYTYRKRR